MKPLLPRKAGAPVLIESKETKYRLKCKDLRKRIREIEDHNEKMTLSIARTKRSIQRIRLERSLLLEKLEERTLLKVDDSDGTASASPASVKESSPPALSPDKKVESSTNSHSQHHPGSSRGKRLTQPRDPNLPKRPQNAYIIFCELEKDRVKAELEEKQPGESFDLTRAMADAWRDLSEEGRKRFYEVYDNDKARYIREMAGYESPNITASELKEKQRAEKALIELTAREKQAAIDKAGDDDTAPLSLAENPSSNPTTQADDSQPLALSNVPSPSSSPPPSSPGLTQDLDQDQELPSSPVPNHPSKYGSTIGDLLNDNDTPMDSP